MRTLESGSSCIAIVTVILRLSSRKSIASARRIERSLGSEPLLRRMGRIRGPSCIAGRVANIFAEGDVHFPRISIDDPANGRPRRDPYRPNQLGETRLFFSRKSHPKISVARFNLDLYPSRTRSRSSCILDEMIFPNSVLRLDTPVCLSFGELIN